MEHFSEANFCELPTQGNVYSFAKFHLSSGVYTFIVASQKKKLLVFQYKQTSEGTLLPNVKEISCSYIPSGAEIISVDAFNKSNTNDDFHIGLAIAKSIGGGLMEAYLNIYFDPDPDSNFGFNIDAILQNCVMLELKFIPYHLSHTYVSCDVQANSKKMGWLLSGSDCNIHVYVEDQQSHTYVEADIDQLFPELTGLPSLALWVDVHYTSDFRRRVSALGHECGSLKVFVVNTQSNQITFSVTSPLESPIVQVKLFSITSNDVHAPSFLEGAQGPNDVADDFDDLHLVVCFAYLPSIVYMNVTHVGFDDNHVLDESNHHDLNICAGVGDINFDGFNEILLGTFGKEILMYAWSGLGWEMKGQRNTANSVHSVNYVDVTGDGVKELLIQTSSGVHILQHDSVQLLTELFSRMKIDNDERGISASIEIPEDSPATVEEEDADADSTADTPQTSANKEPLPDTIEVQDPLSASDASQKPMEDLPCEEAFEQTEN